MPEKPWEHDVSGDTEKARILQGPPVAVLRAGDSPKGAAAIRAWAGKLFKTFGERAVSPLLGDVLLDMRAVRSSLAHKRPSAPRVAAFAAVKDVIERGALVHAASALGMDNFYVAAPILIDGVENIVTVLVHRDPNAQRMYLHSVSTKKYLLNHRLSSADARRAEQLSGSTGSGDGPSVTRYAVGKASPSEVASALSRLLQMDG